MIKFFKPLGITLLLCGIIFSIYQIAHYSDSTTISLPGNVKGFSDVKILEDPTVKQAFATAETAMAENVTSYKKWSRSSTVSSWIAFFLGGIITLLAGYLGYFKTDNISMENLQASIKDKVALTKILGILAAATTLSTGFSVKAKEEAETKRAKGIEIRDLIIASYKDIQQAKPNEITLIIEKLKLQSSF
ncbi:hypothetical protein [Ferruginibacter sp.]